MSVATLNSGPREHSLEPALVNPVDQSQEELQSRERPAIFGQRMGLYRLEFGMNVNVGIHML